jgi:hypothetical protein
MAAKTPCGYPFLFFDIVLLASKKMRASATRTGATTTKPKSAAVKTMILHARVMSSALWFLRRPASSGPSFSSCVFEGACHGRYGPACVWAAVLFLSRFRMRQLFCSLRQVSLRR